MFKAEEGYSFNEISSVTDDLDRNYVIQSDDYIRIEVYTNDGERIIDPDFELNRNMPSGQRETRQYKYLIDHEGNADLPLVGKIQIDGLSLNEASELLEEKYAVYYNKPYVITEYLNKRVFVLGTPGGKVIPLKNENTTLVEVLALAGGLDDNSKSHNIRILRGDEVYLADFSTINGWKNSNMILQSKDVIYVEPVKRTLSESLREASPVISILTSISALVVAMVAVF